MPTSTLMKAISVRHGRARSMISGSFVKILVIGFRASTTTRHKTLTIQALILKMSQKKRLASGMFLAPTLLPISAAVVSYTPIDTITKMF